MKIYAHCARCGTGYDDFGDCAWCPPPAPPTFLQRHALAMAASPAVAMLAGLTYSVGRAKGLF